jgi:hypothetical protein
MPSTSGEKWSITSICIENARAHKSNNVSANVNENEPCMHNK